LSLKPRFSFVRGAALFAVLATGLARQSGIPPVPDRWVTDRAGFLSAGTLETLDEGLAGLEQKTGRQVLVYVDRTTGGIPLEDFTSAAFRDWKVGRKGLDDGLVLFIMTEDRKVRIEVGYGLEDVVPDITAGRIINDIILPAIRNGENDRAVRDGVTAISRAITGEGEERPAGGEKRVGPKKRLSTGELVLAAIAGLFFLILLITNPSLAMWLLFSILSGGRGGGGGGGGGGGFRGGGGRSGGGGASGSW
jgi:uncharacterized protein